MGKNLVFEGRCWKFGNDVPTDAITPTDALLRGPQAIRENVLRSLNPDFPKQVRPGDIICAGRNFGCSSGRAMAPKALIAVGVSVVVAEFFSRTFYRNGYEVGLPVLELPGVHDVAADGDRLRVDLEKGLVENLTNNRKLAASPPREFLMEMLRAGGIIPLVKSGKFRGVGTRNDPPS